MNAAPDNDEIEASRAPLLDHLVELRQRLIVCVIALFVGFLICFVFSTQIFTLLTKYGYPGWATSPRFITP